MLIGADIAESNLRPFRKDKKTRRCPLIKNPRPFRKDKKKLENRGLYVLIQLFISELWQTIILEEGRMRQRTR